jgi:hypothetical protein
MNVKPYSINYDSKRLTFGFESISQKQVIQKIVLFSPLNETATIFNLALCDLDENGELHDDIISNNDDVEKIMATVIAIIGLFFETQPNKKVFFESNSPARTRLYQIAINKVFDSLSSFLIEGIIENKIEIFQKNKNYTAFFVSKKSML